MMKIQSRRQEKTAKSACEAARNPTEGGGYIPKRSTSLFFEKQGKIRRFKSASFLFGIIYRFQGETPSNRKRISERNIYDVIK